MKFNKPVLIVIVIVAILIVVFLFLMPIHGALQTAQNSLASKEAEYNGKYIYYTKIAELIKNIDSKKEALEKIDSALPSSFSVSPIVYFFQKESTEAGMTMTSMTLSQLSSPDKDTKIRSATFVLRISGTYESFKKFVGALDSSSRLFEINSISFGGTSTLTQPKNTLQKYDFNMEVQTNTY